MPSNSISIQPSEWSYNIIRIKSSPWFKYFNGLQSFWEGKLKCSLWPNSPFHIRPCVLAMCISHPGKSTSSSFPPSGAGPGHTKGLLPLEFYPLPLEFCLLPTDSESPISTWKCLLLFTNWCLPNSDQFEREALLLKCSQNTKEHWLWSQSDLV